VSPEFRSAQKRLDRLNAEYKQNEAGYKKSMAEWNGLRRELKRGLCC